MLVTVIPDLRLLVDVNGLAVVVIPLLFSGGYELFCSTLVGNDAVLVAANLTTLLLMDVGVRSLKKFRIVLFADDDDIGMGVNIRDFRVIVLIAVDFSGFSDKIRERCFLPLPFFTALLAAGRIAGFDVVGRSLEEIAVVGAVDGNWCSHVHEYDLGVVIFGVDRFGSGYELGLCDFLWHLVIISYLREFLAAVVRQTPNLRHDLHYCLQSQ